MFVIGLIGGVASGKSWVAAEFQRLGAVVLDADRMGHEVLTESDIQAAVRNRWGSAVFHPLGEIDRATVARIVFAPPPSGPPELAFLEALTHPRIAAKLRNQIDRLNAEKSTPAVILDAPILLKAGWNRYCDQVVFVDASHVVRLARAKQRGWTEEQFSAREQAQESLDYKRSQAGLVIDNSGTAENTRQQVATIWRELAK